MDRNLLKNIVFIICIAALLLLLTIYPFLKGVYDPLATPVSIQAQICGVISLPLIPIGLLGLLMPAYRIFYAVLSLIWGTLLMIILNLIAFLSAGVVYGLICLVFFVILFMKFRKSIQVLRSRNQSRWNSEALYLIILPTFLFISQLSLAQPLKNWSRNYAIQNAQAFIDDIETYKSRYYHYPISLQAMYKDYNPDIVGIEKYHYSPSEGSYNLSFEQPRFLLDAIGTKEWIVYNPKDQHKVFSHTSWLLLLSPSQINQSQGWYDSGTTNHKHWKYFLFD